MNNQIKIIMYHYVNQLGTKYNDKGLELNFKHQLDTNKEYNIITAENR